MFIVIDGIDGSGKATQTQIVKQELEKIGKTVKILDYPRYGNASAYFVEKYLNGGYGKELSPKTASLFYALDRFDDSYDIKKDFDNYDYIISNRYVSASMIHQAGKIKDLSEKEKFLKWLDELEYEILGIQRPDKTIFLNVTPETSETLIENRNNEQDNRDIHEQDREHMINAYNTANYVAKKFNWIKIDCEENGKMKTKEEITKMILKEIL